MRVTLKMTGCRISALVLLLVVGNAACTVAGEGGVEGAEVGGALCEQLDCGDRGQCELDAAGPICLCDPGFEGTHCETNVDDCASAPCQNGAHCMDGVASFVCECLDGFEGELCETNIDDCASAPCQNGAHCLDGVASFVCECLDGFEGELCETNIDDCASDPCENGAHCLDGVASFVCECLDGFEGELCETNIDECAAEPCENGAHCLDGVASFVCECLDGFAGELCETNIDDCAADPCQNGAHCLDGVNSFVCECLEGYEGELCETNIDDCASDPCQNGAHCLDGVNSFVCECLDGYEGELCETNIDDCAAEPCQNGAHCLDGVATFVCECLDGFEGELCETNIDDCAAEPCQNGAHCLDGVSSFVCECLDGFEGELCETNIDDCASEPCQNGAHCLDGVASFVCECLDGFEGELCETNINDCASEPCQNGGHCLDGVASFVCECLDGFAGELCETNIDDCASEPCQNGAHCLDGVASFVCECLDGFSGERCETNIDDCASEPCQNGAHCLDGVASFVCECLDGFEGEQCETNIDDCAAEPCQNGAHCLDGVASFVCECLDGFEGELCETNIDDCAAAPCMNDGHCVDGVASFSCECLDGFEGGLCETNIDDCAAAPCQNGGHCLDGVASFVCECLDGFEGAQCETNTDDCAAAPCQNGGHCIDGVASFVCECLAGFEGELCATNIDDCAGAPCLNGALCHDGVEAFDCECAPGFEGTLCESEIDECAANPCENGGTCSDLVNAFACDCPLGFEGERCEALTNFCDPNPCSNGGVCHRQRLGFMCECAAGYTGDTCDTPIPAELCQSRAAECGLLFEPGLGTVDCGGCGDPNLLCAANACEPQATEDLLPGPDDSVVAHLVNRFGDHDISPNAFPVRSEDSHQYTLPRWRAENWVSSTQLDERAITVHLGLTELSRDFTLSLRLLPGDLAQDATLVTAGEVEIAQRGTGVVATVPNGELSHDESPLRQYDCNHIALVSSGGSLRLHVNGVPGTSLLFALPFPQIAEALTLGPYPGRAWDLRLYDRALDAAELTELADVCAEARVAEDRHEGYERYQCGVFACQYWPAAIEDDPFDATPDNLNYYITRQSQVFERNTMWARLYPRGELCAFALNPEENSRILSDGIRRTFVNPHTFEAPAANHWLHENFHAYQGRLIRVTGRSRGRYLAEATASFGADFNAPGEANLDAKLAQFTQQPHMPLDAAQTYRTPEDVVAPWAGGHMYGAFIWFSYLAFEVVHTPAIVGIQYTHPTNHLVLSQVELLRELGVDMHETFVDFAARSLTWDMEYGTWYRRSETHRPLDGFKVARTHDTLGTGDAWLAPPSETRPSNWAWNAFEVSPTAAGNYEVALRPDANNPAHGRLHARVVVYDPLAGEREYHELPVDAAGAETQLSLDVAEGRQLYLVVVSTTEDPALSNEDLYTFEYRITPPPGATVIDDSVLIDDPPLLEVLPPGPVTEGEVLRVPVLCEDPELGPVTWQPDFDDSCGGIVDGDAYLFDATEEWGGRSCQIAVVCSDGVNAVRQRVQLDVTESNVEPEILPFDAPAPGTEGMLQLEVFDPDFPPQPLTWHIERHPSCASMTLSPDGLFTFSCAEAGSCAAEVFVRDGFAGYLVSIPIECTGPAPLSLEAVQVRGGVPIEGEAAECYYELTGPGGAEDLSTVAWFVGDTQITTGRVMLDATQHLYGDALHCRVTPVLGALTGAPQDSEPVTVRRVRQVGEVLGSGQNARIDELTALGDSVYFVANSVPGGNRELWRSDGDGLEMVADIDADPNRSSDPSQLVVFRDTLYFAANVGGFTELWRLNGETPEMAFRVNPTQSSAVTALKVIDDALYFAARGAGVGVEIHVSHDGESASLFADGTAGETGSGIGEIGGLVGDRLIVAGWKIHADVEPASVDRGVAGSFELITDIRPLRGSSPKRFVPIDGAVLFTVFTGKTYLYRSDGTPEGTYQLLNHNVRGGLVAHQGAIYNFYSAGSGTYLQRGDGDDREPEIVVTLPRAIYPTAFVSDGADRMWFNGDERNGRGRELWTSDGTDGGSAFVADIRPGSGDSSPMQLTPTEDGRLFFVATGGDDSSPELWVLE